MIANPQRSRSKNTTSLSSSTVSPPDPKHPLDVLAEETINYVKSSTTPLKEIEKFIKTINQLEFGDAFTKSIIGKLELGQKKNVWKAIFKRKDLPVELIELGLENPSSEFKDIVFLNPSIPDSLYLESMKNIAYSYGAITSALKYKKTHIIEKFLDWILGLPRHKQLSYLGPMGAVSEKWRDLNDLQRIAREFQPPSNVSYLLSNPVVIKHIDSIVPELLKNPNDEVKIRLISDNIRKYHNKIPLNVWLKIYMLCLRDKNPNVVAEAKKALRSFKS